MATPKYRVYLRRSDGLVPDETKTITSDQSAAASAFAALIERTDLQSPEWCVALTYNNRQLAFHRFDRKPGDSDYWLGKMDQIPWPEVGRPAVVEGGRKINVLLPADLIEIADDLGNGNVNEGVRTALRMAGESSK